MNYSALIVAAGKGSRSGLPYNKVFYEFEGKSVIERTCANFIDDSDCREIILVINLEEANEFKSRLHNPKIKYAGGGATRQESVSNGLELVDNEYVMIHDGARCFLEANYLDDLKQCLKTNDACLLMIPVNDTIKEVQDNMVIRTFKRSTLMAAQTPQCFKTTLISECYQRAKKDGLSASDDAMLVEHYYPLKVKVVLGSYHNIKITTPADLK